MITSESHEFSGVLLTFPKNTDRGAAAQWRSSVAASSESKFLEVAQAVCPHITARAYADDLSGTSIAPNQEILLNSVRHFHRIVRALEASGFGAISQKKTHTFGHPCLKQAVDVNYDHCTAFRLVGASILSDNAHAGSSVIESLELMHGQPP